MELQRNQIPMSCSLLRELALVVAVHFLLKIPLETPSAMLLAVTNALVQLVLLTSSGVYRYFCCLPEA